MVAASSPPPATADTLAELRAQLAAERAHRCRAEAEAIHLRLTAHLAERSSNALVRLGPEGQLQYANDASFRVPELVGGPGTPVREWMNATAAEVWGTGESSEHELAVAGHSFLVCVVPVQEDGETYTLFYLTDVTKLRAAETELREQHTFYEALLQHMPAAVSVLDADQRLTYRNPAGNSLIRKADLGETFAEYCRANGLPGALAERRKRMFQRAVAQRVGVDWEEEWPGDGTRPPMHWLRSYQPVFHADGALRVVISYGLDVSGRRQAEAQARASEAAVEAQQAFVAQVLDLNPNLIYVRKPQAGVVFQNRAMLELRQLVKQLAGTATATAAIQPDERTSFDGSDNEVVALGRPLMVSDRLTLPNGEVRWYQSMKCPLVQPDGTAHVLCVSTDITTLKAAQLAAEAAATARENFLANMSHEIRTPLHGVLGMAALLAKTPLAPDQQRFVGTIQHTGQHLLSVVNDVLDMAKITSGQLELEQTAFNLCESMGDAVQPLGILAQQKGITVVGTRLSASCEHPWVVGDPYRLNQILLNLMSNAIKFTPPGGTITVGGYFLSETDTTTTTEFRVTDTGIGIAPDKLEAIFEEFTQAYADTARHFGGTGLGLSICRALVKQMGGALRVQSEVGQGSAFAFTITLPKAAAAEQAAALAPPPAPAHGAMRGRRVLLAEDNPVSAEVAQLLLASHGVAVDVAASGAAALALFAAHAYDAVLMDIQMPGMNGLEATARLRAHPDPARAATPILALTANAFRADADKYRAAGLNDTLAKPYVEAELLAKLAALLGEALPGLAEIETGAEAEPPLPAPNAGPDGEGPGPLFDLAQLRETAHGSLVFINRILAAFHANMPGALAELRAAQAATDLTVLAALAHRLRPSLQLLGARLLAPHLAVLEAPGVASVEAHRAARALAQGLAALIRHVPQSVPA
ncbi:ATP-binding protein [Hymenobacter nivis]|uniref:histidine kinase n=1 Tax=Hymenobacter nivis TaxID=1850093 RepID=A0A502GNS8_9BACT|nr:ATP-binding protein [Hymenobacter nivis]TPG62960.1 response regulator [Hymenobacter nivis]